jgi:uncharacterized protein
MKIFVKVIPNAKEEKVEVVGENEYLVRVKAPPIDGKANAQVVEVLSDYFHVPKRNILIKNEKSRKKVVEILK